MKQIMMLFIILILGGCATWQGVKKDSSDGWEWTKSKVNSGAEYVKEKTE